jgi:hypothetical protein
MSQASRSCHTAFNCVQFSNSNTSSRNPSNLFSSSISQRQTFLLCRVVLSIDLPLDLTNAVAMCVHGLRIYTVCGCTQFFKTPHPCQYTHRNVAFVIYTTQIGPVDIDATFATCLGGFCENLQYYTDPFYIMAPCDRCHANELRTQILRMCRGPWWN